jgi:hypothetical protein
MTAYLKITSEIYQNDSQMSRKINVTLRGRSNDQDCSDSVAFMLYFKIPVDVYTSKNQKCA